MKLATARYPITGGELIQGSLDGRLCLVSAPLDRYVEARVRVSGRRGPVLGVPPKARRAADLVRRLLGHPNLEIRVRLSDPYPPAKGLGTSTADIAAVAQAVARALGRELAPTDLGRLAVEIEPTDGSIFPGLVLWDHRRGELLEELGEPPPLWVWLFDRGGSIDSRRFNRRPDLRTRWAPQEGRIRRALELLRRGLLGADPRLVGRAATRSLLASLAVLPETGFGLDRSLLQRLGAVGLLRAHSGTVLGLVYDSPPPASPPSFPGRPLFTARLTGGGER